MMLNIIRLITLFIRIFSICIIINVLANNKQYITQFECFIVSIDLCLIIFKLTNNYIKTINLYI